MDDLLRDLKSLPAPSVGTTEVDSSAHLTQPAHMDACDGFETLASSLADESGTAVRVLGISCAAHLVEVTAPNMNRPVLFTLCENKVTIKNEDLNESVEWKIFSPTKVDDRSFFTCTGVLSQDEVSKIPHDCSVMKSDGSSWVHSVNPYITSGTIAPGASLDLLMSYVPLLRADSGSFYRQVPILFSRAERSAFAYVGAIAKPPLDNRTPGLYPPNYVAHNYWDIPFTEIYCGNQVGSGTFGTVFKVTIRGFVCALKYWPKQTDDFGRELRVLSTTAPHENLLRFIGALDCQNTNTMDKKLPAGFILVELASQGNLHSYYKAEHYKHEQAPRLALGIARGLLHLNQCGVIHCDVKSFNVVMKEDSPKLIDFGCAERVEDEGIDDKCNDDKCNDSSRAVNPDSNNTYCDSSDWCDYDCYDSFDDYRTRPTRKGTPIWLAPEVLYSNPVYSHAVDVFSFGLVLYELAAREPPPERSMDDIRAGKTSDLPADFAASYPKYLVLYKRCVEPNPKFRPSFREVIGALCEMQSPE